MKSLVAKRSVEIGGRKTSVSLEDAFWQALQDIAHVKQTSVRGLIAEINDTRGQNINLSSAIRVFILDYYRSELETVAPTRKRSALDQIRANKASKD